MKHSHTDINKMMHYLSCTHTCAWNQHTNIFGLENLTDTFQNYVVIKWASVESKARRPIITSIVEVLSNSSDKQCFVHFNDVGK